MTDCGPISLDHFPSVSVPGGFHRNNLQKYKKIPISQPSADTMACCAVFLEGESAWT